MVLFNCCARCTTVTYFTVPLHVDAHWCPVLRLVLYIPQNLYIKMFHFREWGQGTNQSLTLVAHGSNVNSCLIDHTHCSQKEGKIFTQWTVKYAAFILFNNGDLNISDVYHIYNPPASKASRGVY